MNMGFSLYLSPDGSQTIQTQAEKLIQQRSGVFGATSRLHCQRSTMGK